MSSLGRFPPLTSPFVSGLRDCMRKHGTTQGGARGCPPGNAATAILLVLASVLLVAVAVYFSQVGGGNGERADTGMDTASESTAPDLGREPERQKEPVADNPKGYSKERQEDILGHYLEKLGDEESTGGEGLLETGLNVLFAVANEAQKVALDIMELPDGWDKDAPEEIHKAMLREHKLSKDKAGQRRVEKILKRLQRFAPEEAPDYQAYLVEEEDPNAFAIAGGRVYVTTGMLGFVGSDDELAAVIGHEMAHVYKGHCNRKLKKLALADSTLGDLGTMAANVGLLLTAPFGQPDELEADREGRKLATEAGYRDDGMRKFLKRLEKDEGAPGGPLDKMMGSHPFTKERIEYLGRN
jgi:hypothetical protein